MRLAALLTAALTTLCSLTTPSCADTEGAPLAEGDTEATHLVIHHEGVHVQLETGGEIEGSGAPTLLGDGGPLVLRREVGQGVHVDAQSYIGRMASLHGPSGLVCRGLVVDVSVQARLFVGDLDMIEAGDDEAESEARQRAAGTPEELARRFRQAGVNGAVDVVGTIEPIWGDCTGAIWARFDEQPVDAAEAHPAPAALRDLAIDAFRQTGAYREVQERYEAARDEGMAETWDMHDGAPEVVIIEHRLGTLVQVRATTSQGCGEPGGDLGLIFRLEGEKLLELDADIVGSRPLVGAADLDGDGQLELLLSNGWVRRVDGVFEITDSTLPDNWLCHC